MGLLIKNFDQFLDALNLCDTGIYTYSEVLESAADLTDEIKELANWKEEGYSREVVLKRGSFEVSILSFEPDQSTEIHQHGDQTQWLHCVVGEITREIYSKEAAGGPTLKSSSIIKIGIVTEANDREGFQKLTNNSTDRSICIQIYNHPVDSVMAINQESGELFELEL